MGASRGLTKSCVEKRGGLTKNAGHTLRSRNTRPRCSEFTTAGAAAPILVIRSSGSVSRAERRRLELLMTKVGG
jgi:hypothetical protein